MPAPVPPVPVPPGPASPLPGSCLRPPCVGHDGTGSPPRRRSWRRRRPQHARSGRCRCRRRRSPRPGREASSCRRRRRREREGARLGRRYSPRPARQGGDVLDRSEVLACLVDEVGRPQRVALGRRQQRCTDLARHRQRRLDQAGGILLVPLAPGVGQRPQQPLGVGVLLGGLAVERLLRTARASFQVQRARIWSGASGRPSAIARSSRRTPAERSLSQGGAWVTSVTRSSKSARSTRIETRSASAIRRSLRFGFWAAQVARNVSSAPLEAPWAVNFWTKLWRSSKRI